MRGTEPSPSSSSEHCQTLTYIDHYQAPPLNLPVIRLFGSHPDTGRKSLTHVHGVFPYLYVDANRAACDAGTLAVGLNECLSKQNSKEDVYKKNKESVYRIDLVTGRLGMYGYEPESARADAKHYRVEFFAPSDVRTAASMLTAGKVPGIAHCLDVYESHLSYLLQFMRDYDLAGGGAVFRASRHAPRAPPLKHESAPPNAVTMWYSLRRPFRTSSCAIEVDVDAEDLIVGERRELTARHPDSLAAQRIKYIHSLAPLWEAEELRREVLGKPKYDQAGLEASEGRDSSLSSKSEAQLKSEKYTTRLKGLAKAARRPSFMDRSSTLQGASTQYQSQMSHLVERESSATANLTQGDEELLATLDLWEKSNNNNNNNSKTEDSTWFASMTENDSRLPDVGLLRAPTILPGDLDIITPPSQLDNDILLGRVSEVPEPGAAAAAAVQNMLVHGESLISGGKLDLDSSSSSSEEEESEDDEDEEENGEAEGAEPSQDADDEEFSSSTQESQEIGMARRRRSKANKRTSWWREVEKSVAETAEGATQRAEFSVSKRRRQIMLLKGFNEDEIGASSLSFSSSTQDSGRASEPDHRTPRWTPRERVCWIRPRLEAPPPLESSDTLPPARPLHYSDPSDAPAMKLPKGAHPSLAPKLEAGFREARKEADSLKLLFSSRDEVWLEPCARAPPPPRRSQRAKLAGHARNGGVPASTTPLRKRPLPSQLSDVPFTHDSAQRLSAGDPSKRVRGQKTALEASGENRHLTIMVMEVFAQSRIGSYPVSSRSNWHALPSGAKEPPPAPTWWLEPDPEHDPVYLITYCVRDDDADEANAASDQTAGDARGTADRSGALVLSSTTTLGRADAHDVTCFPTELSLFHGFIALVRRLDPDILAGWEMQKGGLGYLFQRAKFVQGFQLSLVRELSRVPLGAQNALHERDENGAKEHTGFWIPGRHVFNLWRITREQAKLHSYALDAVLFGFTNQTLARYSNGTLQTWWASGRTQWRVMRYGVARVKAGLTIMDHLDVIGKASEMAGILGIDIFSVLTRGSQFQVEAVLCRVARNRGFLMMSPSSRQVASQPTVVCQPYIMEPLPGYRVWPVCVFDFQSLYPSVAIAYNLSHDTCLGRLTYRTSAEEDEPGEDIAAKIRKEFLPGLGARRDYVPTREAFLDSALHATSMGHVFVDSSVRRGVLPSMLSEILDTRIMVKKAMSELSNVGRDRARHRCLDARQFALKMIANVTYGYTAASFSGRMPCAEVAEAIIRTGRDALEKAMRDAITLGPPGTRVVYGDTDSMFVELPNHTLEQARRVGQWLADHVTKSNPAPMELKFDKVYVGSVLQVKKRYAGWRVGAKAGDDLPTLDVKGMETVRRDGCKATSNALELVMRELFATRDLSKVRAALSRRMLGIQQGKAPLSDFILTGKVKLGGYAKDRQQSAAALMAASGPRSNWGDSSRGEEGRRRRAANPTYPPAAVVADRAKRRDPRAAPVYKERVAYVVVCGDPGARLVDLVVDPQEVVLGASGAASGAAKVINLEYYFFKQILPALHRFLCVVGVDVQSWFADWSFRRSGLQGSRGPSATWRALGDGSDRGGVVGSSKGMDKFVSSVCVLCETPTVSRKATLCHVCAADPQRAAAFVARFSVEAEERARACLAMCGQCVKQAVSRTSSSDIEGALECVNLDCVEYFHRVRALRRSERDVVALSSILPPS